MGIFVAQLIGIVAVLFFITSILLKEKNKILFYQLIANFLYCVQYIFLEAYAASSMNFISGIRCFVFATYDKQKKDIPFYYLITFIGLILFSGILCYKNIYSLIPVFITIAYIISSYFKKTRILRITYLICSIIWMFYNIKVKAFVSLVGNIFEFVFGLISICIYKKNQSI